MQLARDGRGALQLSDDSAFDVILLDVMLPDQSGFDVVQQLRHRRRETPVLMLTARDALPTSSMAWILALMTILPSRSVSPNCWHASAHWDDAALSPRSRCSNCTISCWTFRPTALFAMASQSISL